MTTIKLEIAAREVVRQHSMECLSDKAIEALREALVEQAKQDSWPSKPAREDDKKVYDTIANNYLSQTEQTEQEQVECKECGAKQAQIDRLMLEYCPDEMTTEQMQEWGNNQRPAEQAEQEQVAVLDITYGREPECYATPNADDLPEGTYRLYTRPVRTKDLTDDEIFDACKGISFLTIGPVEYDKAIALAVIKKFKEKQNG